MEKFLIVTGANGYLGKYLLMEAVKQGYHVIGFQYDHARSTIIDHKNIRYVHCDITKKIMSQEGIAEAVEGKNIVGIINAAALLGSSDYDKNEAVNAGGVKNLMEFAKKIGVSKFVQISSVVVLKKIKGPYGVTKLKGQEYLQQSDLNYTIFIPAMILGPESLGINRVLKNVFRFPLVVPLIGYGIQTQHPIFVKDLAWYAISAVENQRCNRKLYETAGDTVLPFKALIKMILNIRNKKKVFVPVPVFVAMWLGRFFQTFQKVPVFTAEHVKGVLQDSRLNTSALINDFDYTPTPLKTALKYSLKIIGNNWDEFIEARQETVIKMD